MGIILAFNPRRSASGRLSKQGGKPATVIIFPGVRYERMTEAADAPKWSPLNWIAPLQPQPMPRT